MQLAMPRRLLSPTLRACCVPSASLPVQVSGAVPTCLTACRVAVVTYGNPLSCALLLPCGCVHVAKSLVAQLID